MRRAIYGELGQLPACAAGLDERLDRAGVERVCAATDVRAPREAFAVATITSLLRDHVTLQVRSVDRIFLAGYVRRCSAVGMHRNALEVMHMITTMPVDPDDL